MKDDKLYMIVIKAFENPNYKWRTVDGVAKEASVSTEDVWKVIKSNSNVIIKSTIPSVDGKALYTTREHYKAVSNPLDRLAGAFRNKVN